MMNALVLAVLAAAPADAQEPPPAEAVRACIAAAEREPEAERACVGVLALACVDADPSAAQTPAAMAACYAAETAAWDEVMAATLADIVALSAMGDAAPAADQPALLDAAQTAWDGFRDADCAQVAGQSGDAAAQGVAASQCALERTAARALELVAKRRAFESP